MDHEKSVADAPLLNRCSKRSVQYNSSCAFGAAKKEKYAFAVLLTAFGREQNCKSIKKIEGIKVARAAKA